jgi:hypothetical protein
MVIQHKVYRQVGAQPLTNTAQREVQYIQGMRRPPLMQLSGR